LKNVKLTGKNIFFLQTVQIRESGQLLLPQGVPRIFFQETIIFLPGQIQEMLLLIQPETFMFAGMTESQDSILMGQAAPTS